MDILLTDTVKSYIKDLTSLSELAQVTQYLERQRELGHRLKEPVSKTLRNGIHEIKPGPHRLLFFYDKGRIVIVHAFRKKKQQTPIWEIKTAARKRAEWINYE